MATCPISSPQTRPTVNPSRSSAASTSSSRLHLYRPSPRATKFKPFNPPHLPPPISCLPKISSSHTTSSHSPEEKSKSSTLFRACAEGAAALLVGFLLLLGKFNLRPALALADAPNIISAAPSEQMVGAQDGKDGDDEEMYARVLEKNPEDVEALKVVLYGKMKKGTTAEAVKYVERLIALEPDDVEWRLLQALSYELMGQLGKAKKLFREILKERPLLLRALHGLALAMHKNREGPAVFDMLNKALKLAQHENRVTEERNIKILIAQMHVVKGDLEGASRQFQNLVNENPRDFQPYLCQAADNLMLRRFLHARDLDVGKASSMFLKYLKWKRGALPKGFISESQIRIELAQKKVFVQGCDKQQRPIAVFFGARHCYSKRDMGEFKRFIVYVLEKLCSGMPGGQEKFICIGDLEGWGYSNSDIRAYLAALDIMQSYYPERLGKFFLIHVPYVFMKVWKVIYPFIDTKTRKKFVFVEDTNLKATLLKDIDENQLLEMYGGKLPLCPVGDSSK